MSFGRIPPPRNIAKYLQALMASREPNVEPDARTPAQKALDELWRKRQPPFMCGGAADAYYAAWERAVDRVKD